MNRARPIPIVAAPLVALLTAGLALPASADESLGGATPEALVERMRDAAASRDLVEASRCLMPEARTDMTAGMFVGAMVLVEFAKEAGESGSQELAARFDALLAGHGLDLPRGPEGAALDPGEMARRFLAIDQPAFLADLMAFMESASDESEEPAPATGAIDLGELADLSVAGESATATVGGRPVEMRRLDGRWFFTSTAVMKPGAPGGR